MGSSLNRERDQPLREILHQILARYLTVQPKGFLLEPKDAPRPLVETRILASGGARTLYRDKRPQCRSLDGVESLTHRGRRCQDCAFKPRCTPQIRLELAIEARPYRLLLAHTSAANFLAYDADLRRRRIALTAALHTIEVIDRGSWGELRFRCSS